MSDQTLDYFLKKGQIVEKDAAVIQWYHAANSRSKINEALKSEAPGVGCYSVKPGCY